MHDLLALALLVPPILAGWAIAVRRGAGMRVGFALSLLGWNAWAVFVSELLSIGAHGHLRTWSLAIAWGIPTLGALELLILRRRDARALPLRVRSGWLNLDRAERVAAIFTASCGALIFLCGIVSAPNNWDSMSYHLTRVARWADLHQVAHYATGIDPQLYQPPGAEIGVLQWYVLAGGDRFAFVGQWLAWVGVVLLAHRAAQLLGASRRARTAALVLTATIPMAMLQGSSTQNDLTLALWLSLAATLALRVAIAPRASVRRDVTALLLAGLALGLAVLTKGTGTFLAAPIGTLLLVVAIRRVGWWRGILLALAGVVLVVLPNVGAWNRNVDTYGSAFATGVHGSAYRVQHPTVGTVASNLIRNATNHMDTPGHALNNAVYRGIVRLDRALGQDPNDPNTTFEHEPFRVGPYGPHEDHAGSLLLLLLAPVLLLLVTARALRQRRSTPELLAQFAWLGIIVVQVLLFATLITWQNWHARLHLPMEVLFVPLVAAALDTRHWRRLLAGAVVVSVGMSPIYLLANVNRPLVGANSILTHDRTYTQFIPRPQLRTPYEAAIREVQSDGGRNAGIVTGVDEWEYPLMKLGEQASLRVTFVDVSPYLVQPNPSLPPAIAAFQAHSSLLPKEVVCLSCSVQQAGALQQAGYAPRHIAGDGDQRGRGDDITSVVFYVRGARTS